MSDTPKAAQEEEQVAKRARTESATESAIEPATETMEEFPKEEPKIFSNEVGGAVASMQMQRVNRPSA